MHIEKELSALAKRIFSDGLMEAVLSAYRAETPDNEAALDAARAVLCGMLDEASRAELTDIEALYAGNARYALRFGFTRGVYACFRQFFTGRASSRSFSELVESELLQPLPGQRRNDYSLRKALINEKCRRLENQAGALTEHLAAVCDALENRMLGILRHSFYLGYRHALAMLEDIMPAEAAAFIGKAALLEKELALDHSRKRH